jgi:predicted ATPase
VSESTHELLGDDPPLRDLGAHRLKDLLAPERIYQLGDDEFPPLKSLHQTNLPITATPFMGRARELADVTGLLGDEAIRLLTLTGPGGTGKTRLALQAAAELSEAYRDGVFWVPLAPVRDSSLVLSTVSQTLSVRTELVPSLEEKELLLLLDNFEHVVDAAPELSALLAECPWLTVLVTSRERLQLAPEHEYEVPPLAAPEGVELFRQRARAVGVAASDNGAVAELCRRLDNLPLALELAAARTKLFSPKQLLDRLGQRLDILKGGRDADPRQQTLRATIEWSFELLDEPERRLFARLSIFAGGCDLDAAEAVCEADAEVLASLIDKSLVRRRETAYGPRFWMLETIREYGAERLRESGELGELQVRHADYFLALAEAAFDEWASPHEEVWIGRFDDEQDNFRVAMAALVECGGDRALRLTQRLWESWFGRAQLDEGERWVTAALDAARDARPGLRAQMVGVLGEFPRFRGDFARAVPLKEEALALARSAGEPRMQIASTCDLASIYGIEGDFDRARALVQEALEIERRSADPRIRFRALAAAGELAGISGNQAEARRLYQRLLDQLREAGAPIYLQFEAVASLAEAVRRLGDTGEAARLFVEAFRTAEQAQSFTWMPEMLESAAALVAPAAPRRAAALLGAADAARTEMGLMVYEPEVRETTVSGVRGLLDSDHFDRAFAEGGKMSVVEATEDAVEALSASMPATT